FFQAEDGIRDFHVTGVQTCALPILSLAQEGTQLSLITLLRIDLIGQRLSRFEARQIVQDLPGDHFIRSRRCNVRCHANLWVMPRSEERRVGKEWKTRRLSGAENETG